MAVWHKATEHSGVVGTIRLSVSGDNGLTRSAATSALANPDTMAGIDPAACTSCAPPGTRRSTRR